MFCYQCGTKIDDGAAFCTNCGAKQENSAAKEQPQQQQQTYTAPQQPQAQMNGQYNAYGAANQDTIPGRRRSVTFGEAIKLFFANYANFEGRSTKSEYWWSVLFNFLVSVGTSWIPGIGTLVGLALLVPGLAVSVRRLHDTGKSWVYLLMALIPFAGPIILIVQYCKDSAFDNQWGPAARF